jgi:hypothetical protein
MVHGYPALLDHDPVNHFLEVTWRHQRRGLYAISSGYAYLSGRLAHVRGRGEVLVEEARLLENEGKEVMMRRGVADLDEPGTG